MPTKRRYNGKLQENKIIGFAIRNNAMPRAEAVFYGFESNMRDRA